MRASAATAARTAAMARRVKSRTLLFPRPRLIMARGRRPATVVSHPPRYAIVMAGGAGTRFWPRSRVHTPKQLLALRGERSLLQETVARVSTTIRHERVLVVTARPHARTVERTQLRLV